MTENKRYKATITPMEPYTFGTEQGSMYNAEGNVLTGKESYIMESSLLPEQTTILGALRYIVLANSKNNLLKSDFNYDKKDVDQIKTVIGEESFSFTMEEKQDFGLIKSISPVYIVEKNANSCIYVANPFCNKAKDSGFVPMVIDEREFVTSYGKIRFPREKEYVAKDGYGRGFIEISSKKIKKEDEIFTKKLLTGNRTDNSLNDGKDGFFKREVVSMDKQYAFAVEIEVEEDNDKVFPDSIVAYMGRKQSAFMFMFSEMKEEPIQKKVEDAFSGGNNEWYYALSDLYLTDYVATEFAIVGKKKVRNLETKLLGKNYAEKRRKTLHQISLIKAGSVFRQETIKNAVNKEKKEKYNAAGYNYIIKITEGKK